MVFGFDPAVHDDVAVVRHIVTCQSTHPFLRLDKQTRNDNANDNDTLR